MQPTYAVFAKTEKIADDVQHVESARELAEEHLREHNPDADGELTWDGMAGNRLFYQRLGTWVPSGYHFRANKVRQAVSS